MSGKRGKRESTIQTSASKVIFQVKLKGIVRYLSEGSARSADWKEAMAVEGSPDRTWARPRRSHAHLALKEKTQQGCSYWGTFPMHTVLLHHSPCFVLTLSLFCSNTHCFLLTLSLFCSNTHCFLLTLSLFCSNTLLFLTLSLFSSDTLLFSSDTLFVLF